MHRTTTVVLLLALMSCSTVWAGLLDFLKSPATLIMNQKNCTYMKQITGEVVNGRFIISSVGAVVMSMEKLDDDRVVATMQTEDRRSYVLNVKKSKGSITASLTRPQGSLLFLECSL